MIEMIKRHCYAVYYRLMYKGQEENQEDEKKESDLGQHKLSFSQG